MFSDIDECIDSNDNNCSSNANCTDIIGSYYCTCHNGYTGDGFICDGVFVCIGCVVPVITFTMRILLENYVVTCTVYIYLHTLISTLCITTDIDECSGEEYPCDSNANCTNNDGSHFCTCQGGYTGNGLHCEGEECILCVGLCFKNIRV